MPVRRLPRRLGSRGRQVAAGCLRMPRRCSWPNGSRTRAAFPAVEGDEAGQVAGMLAAETREVGVDVVLELVRAGPANSGSPILSTSASSTGSTSTRALARSRRQRGLEHSRQWPRPRRPSPPARRRAGRRPAPPGRRTRRSRLPAGRRRGGRVGRVGSGDRGEQDRGVRDRPGHRARGVLRRRDRHDAGPADQAERRLDADDSAGRGGRDDRAVGLGADGERRQPGGDRHRGAGTRAGRAAPGAVRVHGLAAERAQPLLDGRERKFAHSDRLALPRMTAPAARSLPTRKASAAAARGERGRARGGGQCRRRRCCP